MKQQANQEVKVNSTFKAIIPIKITEDDEFINVPCYVDGGQHYMNYIVKNTLGVQPLYIDAYKQHTVDNSYFSTIEYNVFPLQMNNEAFIEFNNMLLTHDYNAFAIVEIRPNSIIEYTDSHIVVKTSRMIITNIVILYGEQQKKYIICFTGYDEETINKLSLITDFRK